MDVSVKHTLTADDVIKSGACKSGTYKFTLRHRLPAAMPTNELLKLAKASGEDSHVIAAARLNGYGDGDGYGYGHGYGHGDGHGDGYGYGYGYGHGYGYSYG